MYKINYTEAEYNRFLELSKEGAASTFIYSRNVMKDGRICKYDESDVSLRAIAKNGVTMVPVSFFERFLGIKAPATDEKYLPLVKTVEQLGLKAGSFYFGRLTVIGTEAQLREIGESETLAEAGAYAVFGKYDAAAFAHEDYVHAKDEWRLRLVGSPQINDLSDPIVAEKIALVDSECKRWLDDMNREADRVIVWGNRPPTESADLSYQYTRLWMLARAWGTYGSAYYKNENLYETVKETLDWLRDNMYGRAEIEGRGWRDMRAFNWWDWFVGAAYPLTDILLVIEDRLTMQQKADYLECYKYATTIMRGGDGRAQASSRLKGYTKTALLLEDAEWLERSHEDCDTLMGLVKEGEGIHEGDYVNWTHLMPHNVSYGKGNLDRTLFVSSVLASTPMDFSCPKKYNQFMLAKYCFEPAMYKGQGFMMFAGRSTAGCEMGMGCSLITWLLPMIGVYGEDEDNYLKRMIKRNLSTPDAINRVKRECSIYELKKLDDILKDESIPCENDYEYAHAWFTGDRAAQHRNNYAVGIALSSKREISYESINGCNKTGWHIGDGAVYLYTDYDRHQYDGPNFTAANIDVAYKFPGTTEDSRERVIRSIASGWKTAKSFAGSMQIEDKYIAATMDFEAYHFEGEDTRPDDSGHGGSLPPHENDLVAKKSWFCFDDEIFCLGAGITSTMDSPVRTTVEHRRIVSDELGIYIDGMGKMPAAEFEKRDTGASFVLMDGHCGYVFPKDGTVSARRYVCESAGGQSFFELLIEHGANPTDATYCYAMLPYADEAKLKKYAIDPDVRVISNTAKLQAVSKGGLGIRCYVFHEPGECDGLVVDKPCIVTVTKDKLMVCDPTHGLESINIKFGERSFVADVCGKRGARIDFNI